ncbi:MAG: hypothetical protein DHS20C07_29860 [Methyloligella sp.]|nr:MAG: hypothetical protein DHS20C07_29860 [Methyloligella sp.]
MALKTLNYNSIIKAVIIAKQKESDINTNTLNYLEFTILWKQIFSIIYIMRINGCPKKHSDSSQNHQT